MSICSRAQGAGDTGERGHGGAALEQHASNAPARLQPTSHERASLSTQGAQGTACGTAKAVARGGDRAEAVVEPGTLVWEGYLELLRPCRASTTRAFECQHCRRSLWQPDARNNSRGREQQALCRVPLLASARAHQYSGPGYEILKEWRQVVRICDLPEAQAQEALKERPKTSKISLVTLTPSDAVDAANFRVLRQTLQDGKKAVRVAVPRAASSTSPGGAALAYIFAWKDETLAKKKMPPAALVCFIISFPDAPAALSACSTARGSAPRVLSPRALPVPPCAPAPAGGRCRSKKDERNGLAHLETTGQDAEAALQRRCKTCHGPFVVALGEARFFAARRCVCVCVCFVCDQAAEGQEHVRKDCEHRRMAKPSLPTLLRDSAPTPHLDMPLRAATARSVMACIA